MHAFRAMVVARVWQLVVEAVQLVQVLGVVRPPSNFHRPWLPQMQAQIHRLASPTCSDVVVRVMGETSLATLRATGASNNPNHNKNHLSSNISKWANSVSSNLSRATSSQATDLEDL